MKAPKSLKLDLTSYFQNARKSTAWAMLCLAVCMLGLGISATAQDPKIITFDAPGASTVAQSWAGTFPTDINPAGVIVGPYLDSSNMWHGFLRTPDGKFTTIDVPGAVWGTQATGNNPAGAITGYYGDASPVWYGLLRAPDGNLTTFAAPGAGTGVDQGTGGNCINPTGVIAGDYLDANSVEHGYLRTPDGTFTVFNAPHAGSGYLQGTFNEEAVCMNAAGAITGYYWDASFVCHGYVRAPDGKITEFDAPGAGRVVGSFQGTGGYAINPAGAITGTYTDSDDVNHGFVRAPDGKITEFDAPGAGTVVGSFQGTQAVDISPAGAITGFFLDTNSVSHGFLRTPDGRITKFDVPGAGTVVGSWQGTYPQAINPAGEITGYYLDASNVYHGFLRLPTP